MPLVRAGACVTYVRIGCLLIVFHSQHAPSRYLGTANVCIFGIRSDMKREFDSQLNSDALVTEPIYECGSCRSRSESQVCPEAQRVCTGRPCHIAGVANARGRPAATELQINSSMASVSKAGAEDRVKALYYIMQSAEARRALLSKGHGTTFRLAGAICRCCG